jgi:ATP-dependent RNA helicase DHR2
MSKKKQKQTGGLAQILAAYAKPNADAEGELKGPRGQKRARDGSPIEESRDAKTVKTEEQVKKPMADSGRGNVDPKTKVKSSSAPSHAGMDSNGASTSQKPGKPATANGARKKLNRPQNIPAQQDKPIITRPESSADSSKPQNPLARRRDALLATRQALPIWPHASTIRAALRKNNVLVLTGETGSGKSTQVPQFLLSEPWCKKCIAITQPRRVAAISLARRVAEEMGSPVGGQSPAAKVGYSVRFDNATGPNTRVKFLTEGMLLQEVLRDPEMEAYSAVVVDEVHERSVNVDLILGFLRRLVADLESGRTKRRKTPLKVVIMSATADVESLVGFFDEGLNEAQAASEETPGKAQAGEPSQDLVPQKNQKEEKLPKSGSGKTSSESRISTCFVEGRQYPVKTIYLSHPTQDWVESALKLIFQIHYKEPLPGDILVFLTGQDTIESLEKLVNDYAQGMDKDVPKLLALPLFAALPQAAQQAIFTPAPPKTRKVILSTNIAETSVTVPGIRHVIDSGKSKTKQYRTRLGLESLLVKPISQSAAIQRQGRAGREAPGTCYRLYTEEGYKGLEERSVPEILRVDLSAALLIMKARGVDDVLNFPFLDAPPRDAMEKALLQLLHLGALNQDGSISEAGLTMSKFPLTPTLACVLVEAASPERNCLEDVIDIIAALSVENIFLNLVSEDKKEEAEAARRDLFRREGDHATLMVAVQRFAEEKADRKEWCRKHFISHRAMVSVLNVRKQLREMCSRLKLLPASSASSSKDSDDSHTRAILLSLLRGFISNTARLMPDGGYRTLMGNQNVAIHPSSVLFGRKVEAIVFSEFVFTGRAWARGVSAVQLDWVEAIVEKIL